MLARHKFIVILVAAVTFYLLERWWARHACRRVASPMDPLLSQAMDAIAPSTAPPTVVVITVPGVMPNGNTGIIPPGFTEGDFVDGVPLGAMPLVNSTDKVLDPYQTPPIVDHYPPPRTGDPLFN